VNIIVGIINVIKLFFPLPDPFLLAQVVGLDEDERVGGQMYNILDPGSNSNLPFVSKD